MLQHYQTLLLETHITSLEFYTDGSVKDIGTPNCSASFASVHTSLDAPRFDFSARINNWPSSTRAEIAAIVATLLICPNYSHVTIFTDSQSSIDEFNNLSKNNYPLTP
jgi:ribonuclease HI